MQIIYDDIIYSLQRSGGISLYWSKLEQYIKQNGRLLYSNSEKNIFYHSTSDEKKMKNIVLFERYRNPRVTCKNQFLFHSSYYRYCKNKQAVNITTVHDFTYEYFRNDIPSCTHKFQKKNAIMHSDGVICISKNTADDLIKFYPEYNGKIKVIYHGYSTEYKVFPDVKKLPNLVFIGSRVKYKRFDYAVDLIKKLPELSLAIVGGGELSKAELVLLQAKIPNRYQYFGYLSNNDLCKIYNSARYLLYPSDYEGFGFPILEAQACGLPVICQAVSSIPEVAGDAAVYLSKNIDDDIRKIYQYENNRKNYNDLVEKGLNNYRRFSWEKCIQDTYNFYQEVFDDEIKS